MCAIGETSRDSYVYLCQNINVQLSPGLLNFTKKARPLYFMMLDTTVTIKFYPLRFETVSERKTRMITWGFREEFLNKHCMPAISHLHIFRQKEEKRAPAPHLYRQRKEEEMQSSVACASEGLSQEAQKT